jgi:hypothetical protein
MNQATEASIDAPTETVPVDDLNHFVQILTAWHMEKCRTVQHMLAVPEGSEFQIEGDEGVTTIVLVEDALAAFKLGIEMAMMELGELPFVAEMEDAEPVPG